jgi:hypothetical protein
MPEHPQRSAGGGSVCRSSSGNRYVSGIDIRNYRLSRGNAIEERRLELTANREAAFEINARDWASFIVAAIR